MRKIDINCDMGESFGVWKMGADEEVIRYITSANIACGFHAGDAHVMNKTVKLAAEAGVGIGAHPGFPDLVGFGRRNMECTPAEIRDLLIYQIGAIRGFCSLYKTTLQHVKPHGSLYNMSVGNEPLCRSIAEAIAAVDKNLIWVALGGAQVPLVSRIAREAGIRVAFEAFPDRMYNPDGTLMSRKIPGSVITDPQKSTEQALRMAMDNEIIAADGTRLKMEIHTLCLHGDNPAAIDHTRFVREALEQKGVVVSGIADLLE